MSIRPEIPPVTPESIRAALEARDAERATLPVSVLRYISVQERRAAEARS